MIQLWLGSPHARPLQLFYVAYWEGVVSLHYMNEVKLKHECAIGHAVHVSFRGMSNMVCHINILVTLYMCHNILVTLYMCHSVV